MQIKRWLKILGVGMIKNGCGQSCDGTLKLMVSEECTDGINWFFLCWYKFRQAKSSFNDSWVGVVKNGSGILLHETLKSAVSLNEFLNLADFLNADSDAIIFGQTDIPLFDF